jgi:hypothetical protein
MDKDFLFLPVKENAPKAMETRVYEPHREPCKICNERDAVLLPYCKIDGEIKMYPVCMECKDEVPYEEVPVITEMDVGYYYYEGMIHKAEYSGLLKNKPILTRYGKKLLRDKAETKKKIIGDVIKEQEKNEDNK